MILVIGLRTELVDLEEIITSYSHQLFTSEGVNTQAAEFILIIIQTRVSEDMNTTHFSLFQMHPSKSLGPDSMSPLFFQKYWKTVCMVVRHFLSSIRKSNLLKQVNFTHVNLTLKVKDPKDMTDLRPIAL